MKNLKKIFSKKVVLFVSLIIFTISMKPANGNAQVETVYDFEGSTQKWSGYNTDAGPWAVDEWDYNGEYSLKADVDLKYGEKYYLSFRHIKTLEGKKVLKATVRHSKWGTHGKGMKAKIYVKTGSNWDWHDGGTVSVSSNWEGTELSLDLSRIKDLSKVREIGVEFSAGRMSSGKAAIYLDNVRFEEASDN